MGEKITTLKLEDGTEIYPNVKEDNIPSTIQRNITAGNNITKSGNSVALSNDVVIGKSLTVPSASSLKTADGSEIGEIITAGSNLTKDGTEISLSPSVVIEKTLTVPTADSLRTADGSSIKGETISAGTNLVKSGSTISLDDDISLSGTLQTEGAVTFGNNAEIDGNLTLNSYSNLIFKDGTGPTATLPLLVQTTDGDINYKTGYYGTVTKSSTGYYTMSGSLEVSYGTTSSTTALASIEVRTESESKNSQINFSVRGSSSGSFSLADDQALFTLDDNIYAFISSSSLYHVPALLIGGVYPPGETTITVVGKGEILIKANGNQVLIDPDASSVNDVITVIYGGTTYHLNLTSGS